MVDLSIIPIKNSLAIDVKRAEVKTKIIERINQLNLNLAIYRLNNEFLLLVLNLIEYLVVKKDKINKKELAIEILDELFHFNNQERETVSNNIEFLWNNKSIKKVSYWRLFKAGICEYFFKKS